MSEGGWKSADEVRLRVDYPDDVAEALVDLAAERLAAHGRLTLVLSGGSTPERLYRHLAAAEWRDRIDWKRVEVFQGDERHVGPDQEDSNWRMASESLLRHVPVVPENLHRMEAEGKDLSVAVANYEAQVASVLERDGLFDLVLLGLGEDGHTASLFPGTQALSEESKLVTANEVPQLSTQRLTLTWPALRKAREVWFLVTGRNKESVVSRILTHGADSGRPAALLYPAEGRIIWWLDKGASGNLRQLKPAKRP